MTGKVNAVVSGQSGVAILLQAGELASLHAGRGTEVVRRHPSEARFLLGDATDLQVLEDVAIEEVTRRLELATAQMDAFHTALILLDGSLTLDTRQEAAGELQDFWENEAVSAFVESVLFAHPLPEDADLLGAFAACAQATEQTRRFLERLDSLQSSIAEVHLAWERIPTRVFGTEEDRRKARSVAVREGLFRDLVLCLAAAVSIDQFLDDTLLRSRILHCREILDAWVRLLRAARNPVPAQEQRFVGGELERLRTEVEALRSQLSGSGAIAQGPGAVVAGAGGQAAGHALISGPDDRLSAPVLFFSGLQGETGAYAALPGTPRESILLLGGEAPPREETKGVRGLLRGDSRDLAQAGWGVVFLGGGDKKIEETREALKPLLDLRRQQVPGYRYREYWGRNGYRQGESKRKFLERHGVSHGPADPAMMPYYLLLVGDPSEIPYEFQSLLDVERAVGRICFETPDEYERYAKRVVASEKAMERRVRQAVFFAPRHPGDMVADLCVDELAAPLAREMRSRFLGWQIEEVLGDAATKERLAGVLGGPETTDLLFTAGHGMFFRSGDPRQLSHQGALVCREWPGPSWAGRIPTDFYFAADDVGNANGAGALVNFFLSCYSAGVPRWKGGDLRQRIAAAPQPFTAQLPLRLLSNPGSGALAVIGHIDLPWISSFGRPGEDGESGKTIEGLSHVVEQILQGVPVGAAMDVFGRRYAELATDLCDELLEVQRGKKPDDETAYRLWLCQEAGSYVVLGDPAVRLEPLELRE